MGPLDIGRLTCVVNRSWRSGSGRKGETTAARTAKGILRVPVRGVLGSEVSFEGELKLDDGRCGVLDDEGTGEVGDGLGEGGGDGRRHFEDEY